MRRVAAVGLVLLVLSTGCLDLSPDKSPTDDNTARDRDPDRRPAPSPGTGGSRATTPRTTNLPPKMLNVTAAGCTQLAVTVPADVEAVKTWVPEGYTLVAGQTGRALLVVTVARCDQVTVEDKPSVRANLSEVGLRIEAPDGSEGDHVYRLWGATDQMALASALPRFGLIEGYVPGTSLEVTQPLPLVAATASGIVPWLSATYRVNATVAGPGAPDAERVETWWVETLGGPIKLTHTLGAGTSSAVAGEISAREGTIVATFTGAPKAPGPGTLDTRDSVWLVERLSRT